jgi:hypothetical protein
MINRKQITRPQAEEAIEGGEFSTEVIASQKFVAIILTQSWCPEWIYVRRMLDSLPRNDYVMDIYELEYDKEPYFQSFLRFKENVFGNSLIPYIRYYVDGKLVNQSNAVSEKEFLSSFNQS